MTQQQWFKHLFDKKANNNASYKFYTKHFIIS